MVLCNKFFKSNMFVWNLFFQVEFQLYAGGKWAVKTRPKHSLACYCQRAAKQGPFFRVNYFIIAWVFEMYSSRMFNIWFICSISSPTLPVSAGWAHCSFLCWSPAGWRRPGPAPACPTTLGSHTWPSPTRDLPPHSQKLPERLNLHVILVFEKGGPGCEHRDSFHTWQGLIHMQTFRGEVRLPQFGGVPALGQAQLFSCFTSAFLYTGVSSV